MNHFFQLFKLLGSAERKTAPDAKGSTPRENILSEFFAMTLQYDVDAANAWIKHILGPAYKVTKYEVSTRRTFSLKGRKLSPDVVITGSSNGDFVIYQEHKWGDAHSNEQLNFYGEHLANVKANDKTLIFIGARKVQTNADQSFTWYDVENVLCKSNNQMTRDFLSFLGSTVGPCSIRPLTLEEMLKPKERDLWPILKKFLDNDSWTCLPAPLRNLKPAGHRKNADDNNYHRLIASHSFNWNERSGDKKEPWIELGFSDGLFPRDQVNGLGRRELCLSLHFGSGSLYSAKQLSDLLVSQHKKLLDESEIIGYDDFEPFQHSSTHKRSAIVYMPMVDVVKGSVSFYDQKRAVDDTLHKWFIKLFADEVCDWLSTHTATFGQHTSQTSTT